MRRLYLVVVAAPVLVPMTSEAFLLWEERQEFRHEFSPSGARAMAGASYGHNVVCDNLAAKVPAALKGRSCRFLGANVKLRVDATESFYYPDGMVACPPRVVSARQGVVDNPTVIFEVISPGTQSRDLGEKALAYFTIPTVREYVLLSSDAPSLTVYRRGALGWEAHPIVGSDAHLVLESLHILIPLADLYDGVAFEGEETDLPTIPASER